MVNTLRASIRLIIFFALSLLTVVLAAVGNVMLGIIKNSWATRWKNVLIKRWARLTARLIGFRINIKGTPPTPPFFLVSNHLSYLDVVPLWQFLDATFVAKSEIKSWPFFGWGTKALGVLFIDRENIYDVHRMNRKISDTISENQGIILFPEGTSTKGEQVLPFNAPLLQYPASVDMAVHFATITYRSPNQTKPAHQNICWWGDMGFLSHFWELLKLPGFEADITFGDYTVADTNRKKLATKLHNAVSQNFVPVVDAQQEAHTASNSQFDD